MIKPSRGTVGNGSQQISTLILSFPKMLHCPVGLSDKAPITFGLFLKSLENP
jgi:hypothetical protein